MPSVSGQTPIMAQQPTFDFSEGDWNQWVPKEMNSSEFEAKSIEIKRAPRRVASRSATHTAELEKSEDSTSILRKKVELEDLYEAQQQAEDKIEELQSAHSIIHDEVVPMDKELAELRAINDPLEQKYLEAESKLYQLTENRSKTDPVILMRQEIEIAKIKPELYENRIKMMQLEEDRRKKTERAQGISQAQEDARNTVTGKRIEVEALQGAIEEEEDAYLAKWGVKHIGEDGDIDEDQKDSDVEAVEGAELGEGGSARSLDNSNTALPATSADDADDSNPTTQTSIVDYEELKAKLEASEQQVLELAKEIELLKTVKPAEDDKTSTGDLPVPSDDNNETVSTDADLLAEVQALKNRIELMEPLWYVGFYTRGKKLEQEKPHGSRDGKLLWQGMCGGMAGNSRADASMYLENGLTKRSGGDEFLNAYRFTPTTVWQHRNFGFFQNMLSWKVDMDTRFKTYPRIKFNENFNTLFKAISPAFNINKDSDILADDDLKAAYNVLCSEHQAADDANKQRNGAGPRFPRNAPCGPKSEVAKS